MVEHDHVPWLFGDVSIDAKEVGALRVLNDDRADSVVVTLSIVTVNLPELREVTLWGRKVVTKVEI